MSQLPYSCIIGAGSSGITTAKALLERGLPFDCFDRSDDVGGNWYFNNPNQVSSAYRLLHIDTSKSRMQYSDFPMPENYPNYAHHTQVLAYFRSYADHFGVRKRVTFNTGVEHATRDPDGLWRVRLSTGEERRYDALFVCNGHHWDPRWPEPAFPGTFDGAAIHSHYYRDAEDFRGKNVLILGMGNSAMDISVECSYVANKVFLAARRGAHIIPKYLLGRPADKWVIPWLPWWLGRKFLAPLLRLQVGRMEDYGLPKPDHKLFEAHPSVSSVILDRIAHGDIVPKPNIAALEGKRVRFVDGSSEPVDAIIYCTGYKVSFPFFDEDFISAPDNDLPLYLRIFKPEIDNLFFMGLFQPLGAIFPATEKQACLAGEYLCGRYALPTADAMQKAIETDRQAMFRRYVKSKRHTMQVDFDAFMAHLKREMNAGARRAAANGNRLPIAARARADAAGAPASSVPAPHSELPRGTRQPTADGR
ncbi:MAG TPA: NAD(P)-binding domain-containing protein [Pirellulales bacterium]|nr:NAD(P)-binding domain-containing protein [Pirellulales bacterium]